MHRTKRRSRACTHLADLDPNPLRVEHGLGPLGFLKTRRRGPQAQPLGIPRPSNPMAPPSTTVLVLGSRDQITMLHCAIFKATSQAGGPTPTTVMPPTSREIRYSRQSPDGPQLPRYRPARVSQQRQRWRERLLNVQRTTQSRKVVLRVTSPSKTMSRWYVVFEYRSCFKLSIVCVSILATSTFRHLCSGP